MAPGSLPEIYHVPGPWAAGHDLLIMDRIKNLFKNQGMAQRGIRQGTELRTTC